MRALGTLILSGLAIVFVLLLFGFINGGYLYRVECPKVGGGTETEWTYRWQSVIPYIGYSRSGCEVHTGTKVALDAIGISKIDDDAGGATSHVDEYSAADRESLIAGCDQTSLGGRSFCECAMGEMMTRFSPADLNRIYAATSQGATRYEELPEDLQAEARRAAAAVEDGCG